MKIGQLCFPTPGGSGVVATELGKELARKGHEIHIISYDLPFRLGAQENIYYHKVNLRQYPLFPHPFLTVEITAKIVEVIKTYSLDIIHVHYALPNVLSAVLAREIAGDVRIVTTVHGTDVTVWGKDPSIKPVIRYGLEQSDAVSAVSRSLKSDVRANLELENPVQVIYNFVDTHFYQRLPQSPARKSLARDDEKIILHISNFRPVKRIDDLLLAFSRLGKTFKKAVLVLAGDGEERGNIEEMAVRLGIKSRVVFLGTQVDLVPLLSAADLFLLPSEKESFGLAALEAMACSVPVVATETGGIPEIVEHGKTGLLVPVGDVNALAGAMQSILDNPELHHQMGLLSRKKAENFSVERIIPQYEEFYQSGFVHVGF